MSTSLQNTIEQRVCSNNRLKCGEDDDSLEDTPIHEMNISVRKVCKDAATSMFAKLHSGQWKAIYDDIVAAPEVARKWKIVKNKKGKFV